MNIKKNIIGFILVFAMLFSLMPELNVQAATTDLKISATPASGSIAKVATSENKSDTLNITDSTVNNNSEMDKPNITSTIGWKNENGDWYYYKSDNTKATGWIKPDKNWYYLGYDGKMKTGWVNPNGIWYYLDYSGAMAKGWKELNNSKYFLQDDGSMVIGLKEINGKKYMFKSSGAMATGWALLNNQWYYFSVDGSMVTGWVKDNNKSYYVNDSGAMTIGWIKVDGSWYDFKDDGSMATGWVTYNGESYYLDTATGKMLTNTTIDGYTLGDDGKSTKKVDLSANFQTKFVPVKENTLYKGIDISNWDGDVNFSSVKSDGVQLVYMKATQGSTFRDQYLDTYYTNAKSVGLKVGFYHYLDGSSSPESQAENFYNSIKDKQSDLKPALDVESNGFDVMDYTLRFINKFKSLSNMDICIYTYSSFINSNLDSRLSGYTLWEANYNNNPLNNLPSNNVWSSGSRVGHQYSDTGSVSGIDSAVDLDEFTQGILR
ncbi:GH25 family lysozyme [Clostridium saccharobutylicum]|uniref:Autolytic lysozyme n=1 Tax=Clostridium saccharobutylicum TaxID=169679 RepID=A0A1S8N1U7_CLOSA|nr:GH25 family lysozyme [Clostridium saccharobutylicum]OOM10486.1 autolytic lysozyme [Clostridium saccharobutylicum]